MGFYLHLITLDLLLLLELTWGFGTILSFPWGDRFSLEHLVVILAFALFWDYILVTIQSQIRFFPFYDRLLHLSGSLWIAWVRNTPLHRKLSSLCSKGLVGKDWAFLLAKQIWHFRLLSVVRRQHHKAQEQIQDISELIQRQGLECRTVHSYLDSLQVTRSTTDKLP